MHRRRKFGEEVRELTRGVDEREGGEETTAKEIVTELTRKDLEEELVRPKVEKRVQGRAPEKPHVFSDSRLKNTSG